MKDKFCIKLLLILFFAHCLKLEEVCDQKFEMLEAKKMLPNLFNISYIIENTQNYNFFKIELKETLQKGIGIFSTRRIASNRTILYYKLKIFDGKNYTAFDNFKYSFIVIDNETGQHDRTRVADIFIDSNQKPRGRKPFWGYLINEPDENQNENVKVYLDQTKYDTEIGNILVYKMVTKAIIEPGEEITWCYGNSYERNYKTNCIF
ncbi:hypothetical protein BpHYR1_038410 [Brachionus plicatilis]|uniref:SET domain-containing protein n=1 Tax=Brachionus plicatilis TaxID=10195 RepID=A0A3M7PCZ6_BRAPC|nr:hypothetical protein BpHYR1_038410 [Brachionus plicatilis]